MDSPGGTEDADGIGMRVFMDEIIGESIGWDALGIATLVAFSNAVLSFALASGIVLFGDSTYGVVEGTMLRGVKATESKVTETSMEAVDSGVTEVDGIVDACVD